MHKNAQKCLIIFCRGANLASGIEIGKNMCYNDCDADKIFLRRKVSNTALKEGTDGKPFRMRAYHQAVWQVQGAGRRHVFGA